MKRPILLLAAAAFLAAIPLSHLAMAQRDRNRERERPGKVKVCHIEELSEDGTTLLGTVIEVSERALAAHCRHGDHNPTDKPVGSGCGRRVSSTGQVKCGNEPSVLPPWYEPPGEDNPPTEDPA